MGEREAVLLELRGAATRLLSAAVRLGALAPTEAQDCWRAWHRRSRRPRSGARATSRRALLAAAELEVFALAHARADARLFGT